MGNCWGSFSKEANPTTSSNTSINNPTTPGLSNNCSHTTEISATSSGAGKSQFSEAVSEGGEEATANGQILETPNLKVFSFADLKLATKNFKSDTMIGEGVFGKVYKGWIDEKTLAPSKGVTGMVVAVKKLKPESLQGYDEWQIEPILVLANVVRIEVMDDCTLKEDEGHSVARTVHAAAQESNQIWKISRTDPAASEVNFLGRLSHPNLVKLLGYCREDKELLLVYEYMQKGSLHNHLFRKNPCIETLSWDIRLKIAIGAARALAFLHTSKNKVIYRGLTASDILLDKHFNVKLSDFGLAKLGPADGESHVSTRVMGIYGYTAPEYIATGRLYVKSDVYGFGVVLLEMLTGLRATDTNRPSVQKNLVDWMKPMLSQKNQLKKIMDRRLEGQYLTKAAQLAAQLALKCLEAHPKDRPSMREVVEILEHVEAIKEKPRNSELSSSRSTAQHSA